MARTLFGTIGLHRVLIARVLAVAVDVVQVALFPFFSIGFLNPINDALDLVTGASLLALLGWHWGFVPALGMEVLPFVDEFPTWSALVFFVTRKSGPFGMPVESLDSARDVKEMRAALEARNGTDSAPTGRPR